MCFEFWHGLADVGKFYPSPMSANPCWDSERILTSMIYFDSDMSKSTKMVVYFDWKTVIYIYICGLCRMQFILPNSSRRQFINMYIYNGKVSHMHRCMC